MNETRPDDPLEPRNDEPPVETQAPDEPEAPDEVGSGIELEPEPAEPATQPEVTERPPRSGRGGPVLAFFALIVALAAAAGAGFNWWAAQRDTAAREDLAANLSDDFRGASQAAQERIAQLEERLSATAAPERQPAVADVEHLIIIANRELALAGNHRVALAALREADRRLTSLDDPSLLPVRQSISDDVAAVEELAASDAEGIALRLGSLAGRVQALPLKASLAPEPTREAGAADTEGSGWQRFKRRLVDLASGLFRVRRTDQPAAPLLSPEESFFLHRNVELDLKAARLAAMSGDQANYDAGLGSAKEAVASYFVGEDPAVQSFVAALDDLMAREVVRRWPDLTGTLEQLRAITITDVEQGP
jgi:uroporphyrin-3 C-methyltransferase